MTSHELATSPALTDESTRTMGERVAFGFLYVELAAAATYASSITSSVAGAIAGVALIAYLRRRHPRPSKDRSTPTMGIVPMEHRYWRLYAYYTSQDAGN